MYRPPTENRIPVQLNCQQRKQCLVISSHSFKHVFHSVFSTSAFLSTEVTAATKSRYYRCGTSCLGLCIRKLNRLFKRVWGEGGGFIQKKLDGLRPRHEAGVYPFSWLSLPECMCMQSRDVKRLDLEIRNLVWIRKAFQFVSRRGLCFEYLITSVLFLKKLSGFHKPCSRSDLDTSQEA